VTATPAFTAADVNKRFALAGAAGLHSTGYAMPLCAKIVSVAGGVATLDTAAGASLQGQALIATDDTAALQAAIDQIADAKGGTLTLPAGISAVKCIYMRFGNRGTATTVPGVPAALIGRDYSNISIVGAGSDSSRNPRTRLIHAYSGIPTNTLVNGVGVRLNAILCHDEYTVRASVSGIGIDTRVSNFRLTGFGMEILPNTLDYVTTLFLRASSATLIDMQFVNPSYEGCVGAACNNVTFSNCIARNSGWQGPVRPSAGNVAGFNILEGVTYTDCEAINCGQGWEAGGLTPVLLDRCKVVNNDGRIGQVAFNIGSSGSGVYNVTIRNCQAIGPTGGFGCGNGIGPLSGIVVENNVFDGSGITYGGGTKFARVVPTAYGVPTPAFVPSRITNNIVKNLGGSRAFFVGTYRAGDGLAKEETVTNPQTGVVTVTRTAAYDFEDRTYQDVVNLTVSGNTFDLTGFNGVSGGPQIHFGGVRAGGKVIFRENTIVGVPLDSPANINPFLIVGLTGTSAAIDNIDQPLALLAKLSTSRLWIANTVFKATPSSAALDPRTIYAIRYYARNGSYALPFPGVKGAYGLAYTWNELRVLWNKDGTLNLPPTPEDVAMTTSANLTTDSQTISSNGTAKINFSISGFNPTAPFGRVHLYFTIYDSNGVGSGMHSSILVPAGGGTFPLVISNNGSLSTGTATYNAATGVLTGTVHQMRTAGFPLGQATVLVYPYALRKFGVEYANDSHQLSWNVPVTMTMNVTP
jgi:hypothetical protein